MDAAYPEAALAEQWWMNAGRTIFSQVIAQLSHTEFQKCVARYEGDRHLRSLSCWDQYLAMAFAQFTYRESLRDIEACLRSMSDKLYHMGFRSKIPRSTLADANETHDWRIFADFAQHLIGIARPLHAEDSIGVDLDHTLYALDSTTIDLCLSLFPWAKFRQHKAAVKMHTLLDLRGNIPTFIHITEGKVHDSQYPRRDLSGGWRILRHGPGLHRFRAPQRVQPLLRIFRRAHERERSAAAALLPPG